MATAGGCGIRATGLKAAAANPSRSNRRSTPSWSPPGVVSIMTPMSTPTCWGRLSTWKSPSPPTRPGRLPSPRSVSELASPPAPQPVDPLPDTARAVSGKTYAFAPNPAGLESLAITFDDTAQAALKIKYLGNELVTTAIGLDGVYRRSPSRRYDERALGRPGDFYPENIRRRRAGIQDPIRWRADHDPGPGRDPAGGGGGSFNRGWTQMNADECRWRFGGRSWGQADSLTYMASAAY